MDKMDFLREIGVQNDITSVLKCMCRVLPEKIKCRTEKERIKISLNLPEDINQILVQNGIQVNDMDKTIIQLNTDIMVVSTIEELDQIVHFRLILLFNNNAIDAEILNILGATVLGSLSRIKTGLATDELPVEKRIDIIDKTNEIIESICLILTQ